MPPSLSPPLSIIIVSWNVADLLRDCLRSVADYPTLVVDSASSDETVAMVQNEFPAVSLIACDENVGFARGNNIGLERENTDFVLVLNPDTDVREGAIEAMQRFLEENEDVGMVGPQLLNPDGSYQSSRRRFPTLMTGIFESTWLEDFAPKAVLDRFFMRDVGDEETAEVDWVSGACMMVRREVIEQVGGFDESYFMYSEELDWCRRIKAVGWRIVYLPEAEVVHHEGKSSEQAVTARHINFNRAKLRYFRKFHGEGAYWLLRGVLLLNFWTQIKVETAKLLVGHKRELRKQRIASYWDVVKSGLSAAGY